MSGTDKSHASNELKEGVDFYLEKGLMVFTREYHLKRGYCCGSGCRHCPYGDEKKSNTKLERR